MRASTDSNDRGDSIFVKRFETFVLKVIQSFGMGVMNLVQMNILEAYAILQYSVIIVVVEIESEVMKL